jgi:hypothetical protein
MWGLQRTRTFNVLIVGAVVALACGHAAADKHPHVVGATAPQAGKGDDPLGLAHRPMYELSPATMTVVESSPPEAEPVLVPLPPGAWAALTGLVGLATVAAWRKYRFRHD